MNIQCLNSDVQSTVLAQYTVPSPSQCILELVSNSLDASSSVIEISVDLAKYFTLKVRDNGRGIGAEDIPHIGERNWSTKSANSSYHTYGMKGEALSSIIALSSVFKFSSTTENSDCEFSRSFYQGDATETSKKFVSLKESGTTVTIYGLFYNIPVRQRNIKANLELSKIKSMVETLSLSHYDVDFYLKDMNFGKMLLELPKVTCQLNRARQIYGDVCNNLLEVNYVSKEISVSGYVSKVYNVSRTQQYLSINRRAVTKHEIVKFIDTVLKSCIALNSLKVKTQNTFFIVNVTLTKADCHIVAKAEETLICTSNLNEIKHIVKQSLTDAFKKSKGCYSIPKEFFSSELDGDLLNNHNQYSNSVNLNFLEKIEGLKACRSESEDKFSNSDGTQTQSKKNTDLTSTHQCERNHMGSLQSFKNSVSTYCVPSSSNGKSHSDVSSSNLPPQSTKLTVSEKLNKFSKLNTELLDTAFNNRDTILCQKHFKSNEISKCSYDSVITKTMAVHSLQKKKRKVMSIEHIPLGRFNIKKLKSMGLKHEKFKPIHEIKFDGKSFNQMEILGQFNHQFIIGLYQDKVLCLIDQHAAHERIRLERLEADLIDNKIVKSGFVDPPLKLQLDSTSTKLLMERSAYFMNIGFNFILQEDQIVVLQVPLCLLEREYTEAKSGRKTNLFSMVTEILMAEINYTNSNPVNPRIPISIINVLKSQACHGAIKFGDPISFGDCCALIEQLKNCQLPFQCAHGRPSIVPVFNMKDLSSIYKGKKINLKLLRDGLQKQKGLKII